MVQSVASSWVELSWDPIVSAESYLVLISNGREFNHTVDGAEVNATNLTENTEYSIRVIAIAENGEFSSPSAALIVVTLMPGLYIARQSV